MATHFVSGHLDLTASEFQLHYAHALEEACSRGDRFVIGDARGADAMAQELLAARGADTVVFHMHDAPRHNLGLFTARGGYRGDGERDAALTEASDADIAWVRPGRETSGTARNLARRRKRPVEIVRASQESWTRVRSLRLTALLDAPEAFGSLFHEDAERPDAFWQDLLARPDTVVLIVRADGRDVGLARVAPSWDDERAAAVYSLWVSPLARGRGAGDALMRGALEVAQERGYKRMVLEVGDHNAAAIALYSRFGFEPTGRVSALPAPRQHVTEHERACAVRSSSIEPRP